MHWIAGRKLSWISSIMNFEWRGEVSINVVSSPKRVMYLSDVSLSRMPFFRVWVWGLMDFFIILNHVFWVYPLVKLGFGEKV